MKKRIIYYALLILVVVGLLVCNYRSVQKCGDINIKSVTGGENIIVEGELAGNFRSVCSVKTERKGDDFYITVEAVNDFFGADKDFKVTIPNKKNSVEKVYIADKNSSMVIFINSDFVK